MFLRMSIKFYKRIKRYIWNIILDDAETWTLHKIDQKNFDSFEVGCIAEDGDQLGRLYENSSFASNKGGKEYPTYIRRKKANWVGHFLRKNGVL